jgi:hypothetical protein
MVAGHPRTVSISEVQWREELDIHSVDFKSKKVPLKTEADLRAVKKWCGNKK